MPIEHSEYAKTLHSMYGRLIRRGKSDFHACYVLDLRWTKFGEDNRDFYTITLTTTISTHIALLLKTFTLNRTHAASIFRYIPHSVRIRCTLANETALYALRTRIFLSVWSRQEVQIWNDYWHIGAWVLIIGCSNCLAYDVSVASKSTSHVGASILTPVTLWLTPLSNCSDGRSERQLYYD